MTVLKIRARWQTSGWAVRGWGSQVLGQSDLATRSTATRHVHYSWPVDLKGMGRTEVMPGFGQFGCWPGRMLEV